MRVDPDVQLVTRPRTITGTGTRELAPLRPSIVFCQTLEFLEIENLSNVLAVVCDDQSVDSHVKVVCKIKGIPIVPSSAAVSIDGLVSVSVTEDLFAQAPHPERSPAFQVSIFEPSDAVGLDAGCVSAVFVRAEHVYLAHRRELEASAYSPRVVASLVEDYLRRLLEILDPEIDVLLRGVDVRSNDPVAGMLGAPRETNPDLGRHGVRSLLTHPALAEAERSAVRTFGKRVQYALPFVSRKSDVDDYLSRFPSTRDERPVAVFLETPAALHSIDSFAGREICIGLKDVAQFYFAADRSNPAVAAWLDYQDSHLVDMVADSVGRAERFGSRISLYQDASMSKTYESALRDVAWLRSIPRATLLPSTVAS